MRGTFILAALVLGATGALAVTAKAVHKVPGPNHNMFTTFPAAIKAAREQIPRELQRDGVA